MLLLHIPTSNNHLAWSRVDFFCNSININHSATYPLCTARFLSLCKRDHYCTFEKMWRLKNSFQKMNNTTEIQLPVRIIHFSAHNVMPVILLIIVGIQLRWAEWPLPITFFNVRTPVILIGTKNFSRAPLEYCGGWKSNIGCDYRPWPCQRHAASLHCDKRDILIFLP